MGRDMGHLSKSSCLSMIRETFEWDRWMRELPYLKFPASWSIQIIPPFANGIIRFCARTKEGTNVSVYFDAYDMVGIFGGPCWEIHPDADGDCSRFALGEEEDMLKEIGKSLAKQARVNLGGIK